MVASSTSFSDIKNNWASPFISALAQKGIVSGFSDGTFRPNQNMTRAEFAAIVSKAFPKPAKRKYIGFIDVPPKHWAAAVIKKAYEIGFLSGYPDNRFRPENKVTRGDVLVSLVSGLGITYKSTFDPKVLLKIYLDNASIPSYAIEKIAIATSGAIVVNYPNVNLLNPTVIATRADVAAFIYQALVYLGQVPNIESKYIAFPLFPTVSVSHQREFRGVWLATVWNTDWPSKSGLSTAQQQAEFIQILDQIQALNFNALILQVRPEGDALYASQIEPWSSWLTGTQGKPPEPFYDPLEFAIAQCHKRNIELHAWFNPYRAKVSLKATPNVSPHISVTHPQYVYQYGNQLWMEPGAKFVQDRVFNVILDVVRRYDIDGIHLDDYFYPYPIAGQSFPDDKTYAAYQASGGQLSLGDWRRENVNQLVQRLAIGIKSVKPQVKFGISPFGIYRPGQPEQIKGLDAYNQIYADSKKWLEEGWVDYFSPQLYWRTDQVAQSYPVLLKWWTENNPKQRHIYPGNNLNDLDGKAWKIEEIERQVEFTRQLAPQLSVGNVFFSMSALAENRQDILNTFKTKTYAQSALVPSMQWLNSTFPEPPKGVAIRYDLKTQAFTSLYWNSANNPNMRAWTIYKHNGDNWELIQILPVETTTLSFARGIYALCAADRIGNESLGLVVSISGN